MTFPLLQFTEHLILYCLGTGDHPGIIPRTLTTVFKSIKGKEYHDSRIRPHMFNSALEVVDETFQEESIFKRSILNWNPDRTQVNKSKFLIKQLTNYLLMKLPINYMLIYGNFYPSPFPFIVSRYLPTIPSQKLPYFYPEKCATAMLLKAKQDL